MHGCVHCGEPWLLPRGPEVPQLCHGCGKPLHTCEQCAHLDPVRHTCAHPMADPPGDHRRINDCAVFALVDRRDREEPAAPAPRKARGEGREAWDALWRPSGSG